jgi:hypothetical protein
MQTTHTNILFRYDLFKYYPVIYTCLQAIFLLVIQIKSIYSFLIFVKTAPYPAHITAGTPNNISVLTSDDSHKGRNM